MYIYLYDIYDIYDIYLHIRNIREIYSTDKCYNNTIILATFGLLFYRNHFL